MRDIIVCRFRVTFSSLGSWWVVLCGVGDFAGVLQGGALVRLGSLLYVPVLLDASACIKRCRPGGDCGWYTYIRSVVFVGVVGALPCRPVRPSLGGRCGTSALASWGVGCRRLPAASRYGGRAVKRALCR